MIVLEETGVSMGEGGGGEGMMGRQQSGRAVLRGGVVVVMVAAVAVVVGWTWGVCTRMRVCVGGDRQEWKSPRCSPRSNR